jgi:hypothetical protein
VRRERTLGRHSRRDRVAGARERDEERVALRVDFLSAVPLERLAQKALVLGEESAYRSLSRAASRVEPSMSVKRKVTVPL